MHVIITTSFDIPDVDPTDDSIAFNDLAQEATEEVRNNLYSLLEQDTLQNAQLVEVVQNICFDFYDFDTI